MQHSSFCQDLITDKFSCQLPTWLLNRPLGSPDCWELYETRDFYSLGSRDWGNQPVLKDLGLRCLYLIVILNETWCKQWLTICITFLTAIISVSLSVSDLMISTVVFCLVFASHYLSFYAFLYADLGGYTLLSADQ